MSQSHKPQTHHLARDSRNYSQYEPPVNTQESTSFPSEYQASQAGEILQSVTYSPSSSQVSAATYQDASSENETSMPQEFEPQYAPPPKPPKVPQEPLDEVPHVTQVTAQHNMYPTQSNTHHYESSINQDQHQYQNIAEQSQRKSDSTTNQTAESITSDEPQQQTPTQNSFQSQRHWNHSPLNSEIYQNVTSQQAESTLVSPITTNNLSGEHVGYDDNFWRHSSIQDESEDTVTQTPEQTPSHLYQQTSSGHPHSLQADSSHQHFPSSVGASDNPSASENSKESAVEHDIQKSEGRKSDLRQENSFYWHKESRPSSALSDITTDELEPRNTEHNRSRQCSRDLGNGSTDIRPASESYNASALGFGGPSDWEHFGDYEAQEVDDTDLYNSNRLRAVSIMAIDSAELSAEKSPTEHQLQPGGSQLFILPEPTSSLDTLLRTPPDSTHQPSQHITVLAESRLNKTLELTSLVPPIQPSAVQDITIDSSNATDIVAPQYPQETDLNDTMQVSSENTPSQIQQSHTASHLKTSSGRTFNLNLILGNVTNDPPPIISSIIDSTKESSVNEHPHVRRWPELTPLDDKRISLQSDSIARSSDSSGIQRSPQGDVDTLGSNVADLLPELQASIQPLQSTDMIIDRTDIGRQGSIVLHNASNDAAKAAFIHKKLATHDTVADQKSDSNVFTQTDGSQTAYRGELRPDNLNLSLDSIQPVSDGFNNQSRPLGEKINLDPLTRLDGTQSPAEPKSRTCLKETANEQQAEDGGFETEASLIANVEQHEAAKSSGVANETTSQNDSEIDESVKRPSRTATATLHINDPETYPGNLDAWGRASLSRYLSMLREEAAAKTDKEKLNIFMVFASRETRLRAVLYGFDDGTTLIEDRNPRKHLARALTKQSQKALPALPPVSQPPQPPILHGAPEESSISQGDINVPDKEEQSKGLGTCSTSESPTDEMQYSPGGRPIVSHVQHNEAKPQKLALELTLRDKVSKVFTQVAGYTNTKSSPSSSAPILVSSEVFGSPKPAYVPFKYENHARPTEDALNWRSTPRPYAALNKSSNTNIPDGEEPKAAADKHTQMKNISEANEDVIPSLESTEEKGQTGVAPDLRRFVKADFDPLVTVLSLSETLPDDSLQLQEFNLAMDAFPDDFSFIHQSVVAWDTVAKKEREIHERERHLRQGESERKIDALFDDNEIGYGDISELESEFKNSEAAKKADEDRAEYQTFVTSVYDVVWTRLQNDISQITPLFTKCVQMVNDSLVGKEMFEGLPEKSILAPTMGLLLALHQKLEIRHQKAFEAVLERDRRLKKTEISPWYTLGNVTKVKQLEKQFDSAEKKAIVEFCEQRRDRANKLMDVLDTNTLRGVGANQDYMEAIMKSIRRIASGRAFASMPSSEAGLGVEEVNKAKRITTILTSSSEQIAQTCHVADMLLNAADYEVSVANSKLANAGADTLVRLKEEKSKEDQKLMDNLEHRLALIRDDSRKTHDEIVKLLLFLGVQTGHALSPSKAESLAPEVPGHEDRIQKALEAAKRRNALKAPG